MLKRVIGKWARASRAVAQNCPSAGVAKVRRGCARFGDRRVPQRRQLTRVLLRGWLQMAALAEQEEAELHHWTEAASGIGPRGTHQDTTGSANAESVRWLGPTPGVWPLGGPAVALQARAAAAEATVVPRPRDRSHEWPWPRIGQPPAAVSAAALPPARAQQPGLALVPAPALEVTRARAQQTARELCMQRLQARLAVPPPKQPLALSRELIVQLDNARRGVGIAKGACPLLDADPAPVKVTWMHSNKVVR